MCVYEVKLKWMKYFIELIYFIFLFFVFQRLFLFITAIFLRLNKFKTFHQIHRSNTNYLLHSQYVQWNETNVINTIFFFVKLEPLLSWEVYFRKKKSLSFYFFYFGSRQTTCSMEWNALQWSVSVCVHTWFFFFLLSLSNQWIVCWIYTITNFHRFQRQNGRNDFCCCFVFVCQSDELFFCCCCT